MPRRQRRELRLVTLWLIVIGELIVAVWLEAGTTNGDLAQTGLPVAAVLAAAAVIGLIASLIIFRAPHNGREEL